MMNLIELV